MSSSSPLPNTAHKDIYDKFPGGPQAYREATWYGTVQELFEAAVKHAQYRIDWYDRRAAEVSGLAKRIRKSSLAFFALGTLAPIVLTFLTKLAVVFGNAEAVSEAKTRAVVDAALKARGIAAAEPVSAAASAALPAKNLVEWIAAVPFAEVGYVLLALAGALVVFDQFFDASGSWIRFRQSKARLEVLLAEFRFAWAEVLTRYSGVITDRSQAAELMRLLRDFVSKIEILTEEETKEWAHRFNERIAAFDSNPNLRIRLETGDNHKTAGIGNGTTERGDTKTNGTADAGKSQNAGNSTSAMGSNQGTSPSSATDTAGAPPSGTAPNVSVPGESTIPRNTSSIPTLAHAVTVRLAVADAESMEGGTLKLSINDVSVPIDPSGLAEVSLEIGITHRITASAQIQGRVVWGEVILTPTLNDQGKGLSLQLA